MVNLKPAGTAWTLSQKLKTNQKKNISRFKNVSSASNPKGVTKLNT